MYEYGIVIIGYKNADGIGRLLNALEKADYIDEKLLLIISIDYSEDDSVYNEADSFVWKNGEKVIKRYTSRQGLRNHVLACGNYMNEYGLDAVVVFEDDMMPSKDFFLFTKKATEKYFSNQNIVGISLYTHCINFQTGERFVPMTCKGDNYFFQCAQSRGQVWFRNQWNDFIDWYKKNEDCDKWNMDVPFVVKNWPETSWLKYHIKYCIDNNKYFVYPYISYSTCFGDIGQHIRSVTNNFQVPLSNKMQQEYDFIEYDSDALKYDAYFENKNMAQYCGMDQNSLEVDLYGQKVGMEKRYLLTKKRMDFKVIKSWGNTLIPHEMNIIYGIPGDSFFLYDTENTDKNEKRKEGKLLKEDKKLFLYGSGIEGEKWLHRVGKNRVEAFVDSDAGKVGKEICGKRVFSIDELAEMQDEYEIFISTNARNKRTIYSKLVERKMERFVVGFPQLYDEVEVDNTAVVDTETTFEGKNYVYEGSSLMKSRLGYASYVSRNSKLDNVLIGRYSCIGPNVEVVKGQHPTKQFVSISPLFYSANNTVVGKTYMDSNLFEEFRFTNKGYSVQIGNDVWIGAGVRIMEGVTIADGTIIAAGANVVKDTEPYSIVGGNPAHIIKYRFIKEEIDFLLDFKWWEKSNEWIKENAKLFYDIRVFKNSVKEHIREKEK